MTSRCRIGPENALRSSLMAKRIVSWAQSPKPCRRWVKLVCGSLQPTFQGAGSNDSEFSLTTGTVRGGLVNLFTTTWTRLRVLGHGATIKRLT